MIRNRSLDPLLCNDMNVKANAGLAELVTYYPLTPASIA